MLKTAIRHWDVLLLKEDSLPSGLKIHNSNIFLAWKNNNHEISQWEIYIIKYPNTLRDNEFKYGYVVAKNTTLIHNEHSPLNNTLRNALIPDGVYSIWKQKENTPSGFKLIID